MGRDKDSMISFIKERKWEQLETISTWKAPNSIQMSLVAQFFKLSQKVRVSNCYYNIIRNISNLMNHFYKDLTFNSNG